MDVGVNQKHLFYELFLIKERQSYPSKGDVKNDNIPGHSLLTLWLLKTGSKIPIPGLNDLFIINKSRG